jgi:hypothetical protein
VTEAELVFPGPPPLPGALLPSRLHSVLRTFLWPAFGAQLSPYMRPAAGCQSPSKESRTPHSTGGKPRLREALEEGNG